MKTQEAVIGKWADIFAYYKLPPITGKKAFKGECPICGRKGKFRCDDKDGTGSFICVCNAGDGWRLLTLTQEKDFKTLANEIDKLIGNAYSPDARPEKQMLSDIASQRQRVIRAFGNLKPLRGTQGEQYLNQRGINSLPVSSVMYCDHQRYNGAIYQAIWSQATDSRGELCYLHRILLEDGKKYAGTNAKKMLRLQEESYTDHASSVAIRMFPVASTLGIAEGIETALAAHQLTQCNTWATLNTAFMKRFTVPQGVEHLIIFADSDWHGAGHSAALDCATKNLISKNNDLKTVTIRWPERGDFNDVLNEGLHVYEWVYQKKRDERNE